MPNWCNNKIIIKGKSLNEFKKTLNTMNGEKKIVEFSFHQIVPRPENCINVRSWNIDNWGSKWDIDSCEIEYEYDDNKTISIECNTAWSPPTDWACNCLKKFDDLSIEIGYSEGGMAYFGVWKDNINEYIPHDDNDVIYDEDEFEFIYSKRLQEHLDKYGIDIGG